MRVTSSSEFDVLVLEPETFSDNRGFFFESWNEKRFQDAVGLNVRFVQDNHSNSKKNVLRGLHYQLTKPQGKLVRVARGRVLDVVVDLRRFSPTFGQHLAIELSEKNRRQLWIPSGYAHGFLVLSNSADFLYKTTDYYTPGDEYCIRWDDPDLQIDWPVAPINVDLSSKDREGSSFKNAFIYEKIL